MPNVTFTEYEWDAGTYAYVVSGESYTLEFNPKSIKLSRNVDWRHRHSGTRRKKKTRYRPRETIQITMSGMAIGDEELFALQRISSYNSKWKITNTQLGLPDLTQSSLDSTATETVYFVCTKIQIDRRVPRDKAKRPSDQSEEMVYDYTMTFEMVRDPPAK